ncbi:hypothetical protein WICMUC_003408 [Wickerhamomyces mucosus]|uniref:Pre-mRNA-splicing factor SLT11 n=1 Tax=Wickerhamomyces mucosus TaxID=1378264 RepID=A0A9P8PLN7_9ASCO|nr:hypothetical protein WICMUC_003408 [Wickerhamomyces mucosus]
MSNMEDNEIPAVCETCLGSNTHLRMMRERDGLECKLCTRPFTVFKWSTHKNDAYKKTIICVTCSKQRNCCQSCLLDLTYGIPIQMRDAALKMAGVDNISGANEPKNEISKLYIADNSERFKSIGGASITGNSEKAKEILTKLALISQNKNSNPSTKESRDQLLPDHIDKIDVTKIISKLPLKGSLNPPNDKSITSLFIFGIDDSLPEYKISDFFEQYGKIKSFNCQHRAKCGYITFVKREDAELAAKKIPKPDDNGPGLLIVGGIPLRVTWGKERELGKSSGEKLKVASIVSKYIKKISKLDSSKMSKKRNLKQLEYMAPTISEPKKKQSKMDLNPEVSTEVKKVIYKSTGKSLEL